MLYIAKAETCKELNTEIIQNLQHKGKINKSVILYMTRYINCPQYVTFYQICCIHEFLVPVLIKINLKFFHPRKSFQLIVNE